MAHVPQLARHFHGFLIASLLSLAGLSVVCGFDDAVQIRIGPNRLVSSARKNTAHYEVVIACDPNDAARLVIASMASASPTDPNLHEVAAFVSTDGGVRWDVTKVLRGQRKNESYFDPHVTYGSDGSVHLVAIRTNNSIKALVSATEVLQSADAGKTWGTQATLKFVDRPFLLASGTVDASQMLHVFAADDRPMAAVSRDAGKSFTDWTPMVKRGHPYGMGNPAILSDGTLIVPYPVRRGGGSPGPVTLTVARSTDGGRSYTTSTVADYLHANNGLPSLAVDATPSVNKDRLYMVWPDSKGLKRRVFFSRSVDGGKKWSPPMLLSEQTDEGKSQQPHEAYLPTIAVDNAGVIGVSWYDTRDLPEKKKGWNIRFRCSLDGGQTWPSSQRVTDQDSIPSEDAHWSADWAGDTAGLATDSDGAFHAAWVDNRSGLRQLRTSEITVAARGK